jgi:capsular exopolysaccharide synthesis family protein
MTNEEIETAYPVESFDPRRYLYLLIQWWWLIALVTVLAAGATFYLNKRSTPIYQAQTQLLVSDPSATTRGVSGDAMVTGYNYANTYAEMLVNRPVLEQTLNELGIKMKPEELKGAMTVNLVTDTQVINVTVEDANPTQAMNIANQLSAVFSKRIQELQGDRYAVSKANLQTQMSDMEAQVKQTSTERAAAVDAVEKDRLDTKLTQYRTIYSNLVTSYEQVRLAEAQTNTSVVQVEPAALPVSPVRPRTAQNTLLAGMVALVLAAGGVLVFDKLDDRLKDPAELARRAGLPVIGVIPFSQYEEEGPVTRVKPRSPVSESYRGLRTNLAYSAVTHPLRRIVVTSATPEDGKTTISTNLAIILAQGGKRVALVDSDLRKPRIHHALGLTNRKGLTSVFLKQISLVEALQDVGVEKLGVIASGVLPPNPAELLGSEQLDVILKELEVDHDMIILDTPPVLSVTDSTVMIPYVDGIILVVKAGQTRVSAALHAVTTLRQLGANILGLVINGVHFNDNRYAYYYRSRYYSSYYYYTQGYGPDGKPVKGSKKVKRPHTQGPAPEKQRALPGEESLLDGEIEEAGN